MAHVAEQSMSAATPVGYIEHAIKAGDTTFQVRGAISAFKTGAKIWMDFLGGNDEVRTVASVENRTITVTTGFSFSHNPGAPFQRSDSVRYLLGLVVSGGTSLEGAVEVTNTVLITDTTTLEATLILSGVAAQFSEMSDPSAPAASKVLLYARDTGGKTELVARFPTGAIQQVAIEP